MDLSTVITQEEIFENCEDSRRAARQKRFHNVNKPITCELNGDKYVLKTEMGKLELDKHDEIVLTIICKYKFSPTWLVKQWYAKNEQVNDLIGEENTSTPVKKLTDFIEYGLLYEYPGAVFPLLMPTTQLATILGIELYGFREPSYNILTHTVCEQQMIWEFSTGRHSKIKELPHFPYTSQLGFERDNNGAMIIPELDFTSKIQNVLSEIEKYNDEEAKLTREMLDGKIITTSDIKELNLEIHKKIGPDEYITKVPDLAILAPRVVNADGISLPQSTAVEIELTAKKAKYYNQMVDLYWDNLKFGHCLYLVPNSRVGNAVANAVKRVSKKHEEDDIEQLCDFEIAEIMIPCNEEQLLCNQAQE